MKSMHPTKFLTLLAAFALAVLAFTGVSAHAAPGEGYMTLKAIDGQTHQSAAAHAVQARAELAAPGLPQAQQDDACQAKPAPVKPGGKAPGKGGGKKKCISASVPLDDGYLLAARKKAKDTGKARARKTT